MFGISATSTVSGGFRERASANSFFAPGIYFSLPYSLKQANKSLVVHLVATLVLQFFQCLMIHLKDDVFSSQAVNFTVFQG